tara:strand:- start:1479 stop:2732 length:1254 start_codon:yes stop_codon:yes gene_type:complete
MATTTTTSDPYIGEIRHVQVPSNLGKNVDDITYALGNAIMVYEVYGGPDVGWYLVGDQATAKKNYENQAFAQSVVSDQQEAGLEPVSGTSLDGGSLRYPSDIAVTDKSHYVLFDFKKYNPPFSRTGQYSTTTDTNGTTTVSEDSLANYNQSAEMMTPSGAPQIMLYMPEGIASSYKTNWDGKAFGNAVAGILKGAGSAADGQYMDSIRSTAKIISNQWEKLPATLGAAAIQKAAKAVTGDSIGMQDVFSAIGGGILNPNVELIFGGHDLRTLTLTFLMVPYNKKEAQIIEGIVKTFKKSMLPSMNGQGQDFWSTQNEKATDTNRAWLAGWGGKRKTLSEMTTFISNPDLVKVTFMQGGGVNSKISQFKTMSITDFDVNYTPDGTYAVGPDGYPVATQIQVNLMESKLVYAEDIDSGY